MMALLMGVPMIAPRDVLALARNGGVRVFDVNALESWQRAHVPGSRHLDPTAIEPRDLPEDRNAALVFYCSNPMCRKAPRAARRARELGWTNARVMSAGIQGWLAAGLPTESAATVTPSRV